MKKQKGFTPLEKCSFFGKNSEKHMEEPQGKRDFLTGFTLIELLIVIAIIGILSSVVLVSLSSAREKAKLAKALSTMETVNKVAYGCFASNQALIIPAYNQTGGTSICDSETATLPDLSSVGFYYCGTGCGTWGLTGTGYGISVFSDSYSGGSKIIVCGTNIPDLGWYNIIGVFDFTGKSGCIKYGF